MRIAASLLVAALTVGCNSSSKPSEARRSASPRCAPTKRVTATVEGVFDGKSLTFRPIADTGASALVEVPVVQDGKPGTNPPDTLEMVTESMAWPVANGCGDGGATLDANVTVRSFFPKALVYNAYFEILTIPTGHEACNSTSPAPEGTSNQWGLFSYGRLESSLFPPNNAATATWQLRHPNEEPFTFRGRIVADVEFDTTPPSTVNMPVPGRFAWPIQFDAQCADDDFWLADCAGTYYTLDGSTPTTGSIRFSGPFTISETTTVKIFSVDSWGNAEPFQTLEYIIDTVPPAVLSTSPAAWSTGTDPAAPISVTFSEPVEPASVSISLTDASGYPYSPFLADADGDTFTFTPGGPFGAGTVLTLTVSGAMDLVGLWLPEAVTATFEVGAMPALAATSGPAKLVNQALVTNSAGDQLAVWAERTGAGGRLHAARRLAGGEWEAPVLLDEGPTPDVPLHAVAIARNTDFVVSWSGSGATRIALIARGSATPVWTRTLWASATELDSLSVVPSSGGFSVVRASGMNIEHVWCSEAGALQPSVVLATDPGAKWPRLAEGNDLRLHVVYAANDGYRAISMNAIGDWGTSAILPGGATSVIWPQVPPLAFTTATGVEAIWASPGGGVFASENTGAGFGPALELSGATHYPPSHLSGWGRDDYRAVAWNDSWIGPFGTVWGLVGAIHQGGVWTAAEPILADVTGPTADPSMDSEYTVAAIRAGDLYLVPVYTAPPDPYGWGAGAGAVLAETGAAPARTPLAGLGGPAGPTIATWSQQPSTGVDALWWTELHAPAKTAQLGQSSLKQEALDVSASAALNGYLGASWMEQRPDATTAIGAYGTAAGWLNPNPLSSPNLEVLEVARVATRAESWLVYAGRDGWASNIQVVATPDPFGEPFSGSLLGSRAELAVAGSADGALIAWATDSGIDAVTFYRFRAPQWSVRTLVSSASSMWRSYLSAALGEGGNALVGWRNGSAQPAVLSLGSLPPVTFSATLDYEGPKVAVTDGAGPYAAGAAAWHVAGKIYVSSVDMITRSWATPEAVSAPGTTCDSPQLASDGSTFMAVFECGTDLVASRFDGASWSAPFLVTTGPLAWSLAGAPSGYRVALVHDDWDGPHAFQIRIDGTTPEMPTRIDTEPGAVRPRIRLNADNDFFCAGWSQVVDDPLAAQPRARCFL